ncbi:MAG: caspase family protein [Chitinivibrionales bacterium]|nr:caspase family protein [Chitinivibrionales bacterium]
MKRYTILYDCLFLLCLLQPNFGDTRHDPQTVVYRNAVIIGANTASQNRQQLRYAVSDAHAFARVFRNLGGIAAASCVVVEDPSIAELTAALRTLKNSAEKNNSTKGRTEVLFYYSGHADERGLLIGDDVYEYSALKRFLNSIAADVHIAIIDACASGSLTRQKGGTARPPFLFDASSQTEGHAYLTSAASDESAMESDQIKGSFFTHALVSGLRGGADFNGDGKVTLHEAYQYTFSETLKKTEKTIAGPQHPGYEIRLKGSGDLVMTDLRTAQAGLGLRQDVQGTVLVHDSVGTLVLEINKQQSKPVEIGLEAGVYEVVLVTKAQTMHATVALTSSSHVDLSLQNMKPLGEQEAAALRGTISPASDKSQQSQTPALVPLNLQITPSLQIGDAAQKTRTNCLVSLAVGQTDQLQGVAVSSALCIINEWIRGCSIAAAATVVSGGVNSGLLISGGFNTAGQAGALMQISGGFNRNTFAQKLFQVTGGFNTGSAATEVQISGGCNLADKTGTLMQLTAGFNYNTSANRLIQIAGGANVGCGTDAVQISGGFNAATAQTAGVQISGGANVVNGMLRGVQIAGGFNYASDMYGCQIGVVNCGKRAHGLQLGVVNIAETNDGVPIGVLSLVKSHPPVTQVWLDETGFFNIGIRSGSRFVYSYLGVAATIPTPTWYWGPQLGIGFRMPMETSFLGIDFMTKQVNQQSRWADRLSLVNTVRLISGYAITPHLSIWGGLTFTVFVHDHQTPFFKGPSWRYSLSSHTIVWPGFVAGMEF